MLTKPSSSLLLKSSIKIIRFNCYHASRKLGQPLNLESAEAQPIISTSWIFGPITQKHQKPLRDTNWDFAGLLTVDHREPIHIKTALENRGAIISTLPIGDFGIWKKEVQGKHVHPTLQDVDLTMVVERKEVKDFARSVVDGRLATQLAALKESGLHHVHIIEGPFQSSVFKESASFLGVPEQRFLESLVELVVDHSCRVMHTMDSGQTMRLLEILSQRCQTAPIPKLEPKNKSLPKRTKTVLSVPSGVDSAFCQQLIGIKGISLERAITLANLFSTPAQLMKFMEIHGPDALAHVKPGESCLPPEGKAFDPRPKDLQADPRRSFGKQASKNVYRHFFGK